MAMDVVGPIPTSARGNNFILVMNEYLARYMIAAPMPDQKAETVKKIFSDSVILEYGVPERVLTDQGTNFLSQTMDILYGDHSPRMKYQNGSLPVMQPMTHMYLFIGSKYFH